MKLENLLYIGEGRDVFIEKKWNDKLKILTVHNMI